MANTAIEHLNLLVKRSYDAQQGFQKAAEDVENPLLKDFLLNHSLQRTDFLEQLKAEVRNLGGTPEDSTSILGDLHRAWIDFRSALSTRDEKAVLDECERGETTAYENYSEVLADTALPESTRTLLQRQQTQIGDAIQKIKALKVTFSNS
ncbi:MAG: PA2169 family four-helix-bundle protein [Chitinophagales bacterium]|nr:PA2169 family four-helix-bundle protein [Chitinophagales bacterium]